MLFSFVSHEVLHIMQDNERSSVMKSCRILCKNIVLLRSELDKCIPNVYFECMDELRVRIIAHNSNSICDSVLFLESNHYTYLFYSGWNFVAKFIIYDK